MKISVIIPTLNEAGQIGTLVRHLRDHGGDALAEIYVCDGGSKDATREEATLAGAEVLACPKLGRAVQMNFGAAKASGEILWFVHADTLPPASFVEDLRKAVQSGHEIGGYRFRFDSKRPVLRILSWFTRFDWEFSRGGDQSLFVSRALFERLEGYREDWVIMEEYEFIKRARRLARFRIIPQSVKVSARKYAHNSWWQVQKANYTVFRMYRKGQSPGQIKETYFRLLRHPKDDGGREA